MNTAGRRRDAVRLGARVILGFLGVLVAISALPMLFGWRSDVVMSGSMSPSIHVGDVVVVAPTTLDQVKPGDVVTVAAGGKLIVHRVVAQSGATLVTRGDANPTSDAFKTTTQNLRGKVRLRIPLIGYPVLFAWRHSVGDVVALAAILGVLMLLVNVAGKPPNGLARHRSEREGPRSLALSQ